MNMASTSEARDHLGGEATSSRPATERRPGDGPGLFTGEANDADLLDRPNTPRVWIGCLACHNAGHLVDEWFDAVDCPTEMDEWNELGPHLPEAFWSTHVAEGHEELLVFDHENFHGLLTDECSPADALRIANVIEALPDHYPAGAFAAWCSNDGREGAKADYRAADVKLAFEDAYAGEWESEAEFAEEMATDAGLVGDESTNWPNNCIDWARAWRELHLGGDYWSAPAPGGRVYVFRAV